MTPVLLTQRDAFAYEYQVGPIKWSGRNLSRLLRRTGERPERVAEMWSILGALGMGQSIGPYRRWPAPGGVFDHGAMWGRFGQPWAITGNPYRIDADERDLLDALARFGTLRVGLDDRPSIYGHGTHQVLIALVEPRAPFVKPRGTAKTRAAARAAREAFAEEFGPF